MEPYSSRIDRAIDWLMVKFAGLPEITDGSGKVLHVSDTPTTIYSYLSRFLRRVNPSVIIHTGDFADDIKLQLYKGEAGRYETTMRRFVNMMSAPHRIVYLTLGNHDDASLLPPSSSSCSIVEGACDIELMGATFRASHYAEEAAACPMMYNLFGHAPDTKSYSDDQGRIFLNGLEGMRLIDPRTGEILLFRYPRGTDLARLGRSARR
ncbi:hypothetical protein FACS1894216_03640 [Synergistales bacterium]|nr:hypothetical protein FACS1894216_03640 [Synergistales bacterium]